jgi:hypothetical protein
MKFNDLYKLVCEVNVISTKTKGRNYKYIDEYDPIHDNETIRVYHAFNDIQDAIKTLKYGISGKERIGRRYPYENNNNPRGLFVSLSLDVVKDFGNTVIEFHTPVSDLEAPVWPGGGYTVQGQMVQYFEDDDDREQARLNQRKQATTSKYNSISKSDRPELAETLFNNSENQALFIGELNPNSIRAVWINTTPEKSGRFSTFKRLSRKEFLKEFGNQEIEKKYDDYRIKDRLMSPREKFDLDVFLTRAATKYPQGSGSLEKDKKELFDILKNVLSEHQLLQYLWPRQLEEFKKIKSYDI